LAIFFAQLPIPSGQAVPLRGLSFAFSLIVLSLVLRLAR
jgi:hypothetical protein